MPSINLVARDSICGYGRVYDRRLDRCVRVYSKWDNWGRWILLGAAILLFALSLACCFRSRRQRQRGRTPMYGTGWMAPQTGKFAPQQPQWGGQGGYGLQNQPPQGPAPPPYGQDHYAPPPADGYGQGSPYAGYNPQETGVQQPPSTYQPPYYAPPAGPPPGK
ncbi:uncharacterized protein DNG_03628 [Cephalotrichum gorgonifer]|uniref:Chitin synthesis regulation, Congo red resistance, RCR protein n=1 Tax=Cephalotrichum gorgonifer TaxID=2041049 RepID=A0AAE8MXC3_9PEZI|nr:uncharacterized protein DNG_03628 [Cephalotrichum gorgonifer]